MKNFRSIQDERFVLPDLTVLVGKNDVGKSNLLEAVKILLEGTAASVEQEDFYDLGNPIETRAVLDGIGGYLELCDQRNRPKVEQRIHQDGLLTIRRIAEAPKKLGDIEILDPASGEFSTPTGIDAALKPMLPEVIFIEALADVAEETKGTQKDALGMLVSQVMSSIVKQVEPSLKEAYKLADKLLNVQRNADEERDERAPELVAIESEITEYVKETFPGASVRLKVQLASAKEILERVHVLVREGKNEDPYYRRGHGLQRTLYLSLLRALAARIRKGQEQAVSRPFILLFEEPEAFLHPEGQVKMRNALEAISTGAQVIMTTHSPLMVTPDSLSRTTRVEKCSKAGCPKPVTRRFGPVNPEELTVPQRQLLPLFAIQRSSRFLFARGVLLVEGVGDEHIFAAVAERLRRFCLEANEIAIVEAGGKAHLATFAEILKRLGLEVWVLTDIDFLWEGAGRVFGGDADHARFMEGLQQLVPTPAGGIRDDNARRQDKLERIRACVSQLSTERDTLCEKLLPHHIFVLRHGEIEDYIGLGHGSKGQYLKAANEIRAGTRAINHEQDFVRLLDALAAWASP